MQWLGLVIIIALLQYMFFVMRTGLTRGKYQVEAPKMAGNDTWERILRVQQNTMEQLVLFIPGSILFAHFVSQLWVLVPGALFIVGRSLFSYLYIKDPKSRAPGMVLTFLSNVILIVGSLIGLLLSLN